MLKCSKQAAIRFVRAHLVNQASIIQAEKMERIRMMKCKSPSLGFGSPAIIIKSLPA